MRILAIDPGTTGALCLLDGDAITIRKMPSDPHGLAELVREWVPSIDDQRWGLRGEGTKCIVEKVHAGGSANADGRKMGASSAFTFGRGFGTILGVLAALEVPYELVSPVTWTGKMGERGKDKNSHWGHAKRLFPGVKVYKYAADAVLLAEYGRRFTSREYGVDH